MDRHFSALSTVNMPFESLPDLFIFQPRWVWLSSKSTGRRVDVRGNTAESVRLANMIVARWTILVAVALSRDVHWVAARLSYYKQGS